MKNENLYEQLKRFEFPESFLPRLCRENGWTAGKGVAVLEEYRKFVYLAMVSPEPVTPPLAVDQAWHLHLIYTRSYWEELCGKVLPKPLHHGPTEGGPDEDEKFMSWYERTRQTYFAEFGELPPLQVWPRGEERFDSSQRLRFLDTSRFWIIPKQAASVVLPSVIPLAFAVSWGGIGATVALLMGFLLIGAIRSNTKRRSGGDAGGCGGGTDYGGGDSCDGGSGDSCGDGGGGCGSGCGGGGCGGGD